MARTSTSRVRLESLATTLLLKFRQRVSLNPTSVGKPVVDLLSRHAYERKETVFTLGGRMRAERLPALLHDVGTLLALEFSPSFATIPGRERRKRRQEGF